MHTAPSRGSPVHRGQVSADSIRYLKIRQQSFTASLTLSSQNKQSCNIHTRNIKQCFDISYFNWLFDSTSRDMSFCCARFVKLRQNLFYTLLVKISRQIFRSSSQTYLCTNASYFCLYANPARRTCTFSTNLKKNFQFQSVSRPMRNSVIQISRPNRTKQIKLFLSSNERTVKIRVAVKQA